MSTVEKQSSLDANLVNAVIKSTTHVLITMANTEVTPKEIQAESAYQVTGDISAVIGVLGEDGEGIFAISFSTKLATLFVSRLLGIQPDMLSYDDRKDGVGELMNMISGNAKAILFQNSQVPYRLSLPSVIVGNNHEVVQGPKNTPYIVIAFDCEGERFHVRVCFKAY